MSFQVNNQQWYVLEECVKCGCIYAVTSNFQSTRKEDKATFYCPNGHPQSYTKSTAQTLQEKVTNLETIKNRVMLERDEAVARAHRAEKKLEALKKKEAKQATK
jgi:hypothetical protein